MKRKSIYSLIFLLFLVLPTLASAQGIDVAGILNRVKGLLWMVLTGLVVIVVTWAGLMYITARGEPSKIQSASKALIWAAVGAAVGILAWSACGIVNWFITGNVGCPV